MKNRNIAVLVAAALAVSPITPALAQGGAGGSGGGWRGERQRRGVRWRSYHGNCWQQCAANATDEPDADPSRSEERCHDRKQHRPFAK